MLPFGALLVRKGKSGHEISLRNRLIRCNLANWTEREREREDGPRAPRAARMVVGPAGIPLFLSPLSTPPVAGSESFNEITCDRRSKLDRSSRMRRRIHVSGEKVRGALPIRVGRIFFSALLLSSVPSSLSSFCLFSLSAATTFHPFFVPRTLNRRISCAAPARSLPSYSASVAAAASALAAAALS